MRIVFARAAILQWLAINACNSLQEVTLRSLLGHS